MRLRTRFVALGALIAWSTAVSAQVPDSLGRGAPPRGKGARGQQQAPGGRMLDGRPMERQVQQAIAQAVRRQLNLDDERMRQLQRTTAKFENERRVLLRDERDARQTLRRAIEDSAATDQARIESAMGKMIQIQRKRVDMLEAEQKDLATFLTPKQRAQYFALRERITRRLMELEQGGAPGRRGGPPPR
jgi:periplasmic protein CpxP/Spy